MRDDLVFRRGLSDDFVAQLMSGHLAPLLSAADNFGLDVQIRENYLNFYYEGLSLLKLSQNNRDVRYRAVIHREFLSDISYPEPLAPEGFYCRFAASEAFVAAYVANLERLLANAQPHAKAEAAIEQRIIKAGCSPDAPLVLIDRQVQLHGVSGRADMVGMTGDGQFVIVELKQGLDNRIQHLLDQMRDYYTIMAATDGLLRMEMAHAYRKVVQQKQSLGLLPPALRFPEGRPPVTCLLVLYDYNPASKLLTRLLTTAALHSLPIALVELPPGSYTLPPAAAWKPL
ncbi:MAG: hypothetical protein ABFD92_07540 [Planctomycetaceae bacterium]|nr:hypothetical protein [Planctomycetaceae bacterium]